MRSRTRTFALIAAASWRRSRSARPPRSPRPPSTTAGPTTPPSRPTTAKHLHARRRRRHRLRAGRRRQRRHPVGAQVRQPEPRRLRRGVRDREAGRRDEAGRGRPPRRRAVRGRQAERLRGLVRAGLGRSQVPRAPAPGNHEYYSYTKKGDNEAGQNGNGYFAYFNGHDQAGTPNTSGQAGDDTGAQPGLVLVRPRQLAHHLPQRRVQLAPRSATTAPPPTAGCSRRRPSGSPRT